MRRVAVVALVFLVSGCRGDGTGPGTRRVTVTHFGSALHYSAPSVVMSDVLGARVADNANGRGVNDVAVVWRVVSGTATVTGVDTRTDEFGVARGRVTVGAGTGTVIIEADVQGRTGEAPRFTIHVIERPEIESVSPAAGSAGTVVTVRGRNFGSDAAAPRFVRFGGLRGRIITASDSLLTAEVPQCVQAASVSLDVGVGASISTGVPFNASAPAGAAVDFPVGQPQVLRGAELDCLRVPAPPGAEYLLMIQNAHRAALPGSPFELRVHVESTPPVVIAQQQRHAPFASPRRVDADWELRLRRQEALWGGADAAPRPEAAMAVLPAVGERRQFNVLKADLTFARVTAEVRFVSQRSIIYHDLAAPQPRLTDADFAYFAGVFDDPIHTASVPVFGEPSDIDGNGRAIILFTPQVNALTRPSDEGFIAGFFYGCDLLERSRCAGTNGGEVFYAMVPDDAASFGKRRTRDEVVRTLPGVLAHEYQHMIHFAQRGQSLDLLWLSEGLAHATEDLVARVLQASGRTAEAADMRRANTERGREYVRATTRTSLIGEANPGSLAMRGGAWLLVEYLAGQHGGDALLRQLTQTQAYGVTNIEQQTGKTWPDLLADFGLALVADGRGWPIGPRWTFTRINLQSRMASDRVAIAIYPSAGALDALDLPASSIAYGGLVVPLTSTTFTDRSAAVALTGLRGGPFTAAATPQLLVLRLH